MLVTPGRLQYNSLEKYGLRNVHTIIWPERGYSMSEEALVRPTGLAGSREDYLSRTPLICVCPAILTVLGDFYGDKQVPGARLAQVSDRSSGRHNAANYETDHDAGTRRNEQRYCGFRSFGITSPRAHCAKWAAVGD